MRDTLKSTAAAVLLIGAAATLPALAAEVEPAVVYDLGGKFDKSFNEAAFNGAKRFTEETGIAVREFEPTNETQIQQAHRRFAERGANYVAAIGFSQGPAVETVAQDFPEARWTLVDSVVDLPNVRSVLFKEHEGSFLVGLLAAMASQTGTVGFVGGMDIPLIRKFACGYEQGAVYADPDVEVIQNMTGTTPAAWNDPGRGGELAKGQFDRGADVIYAAAGNTGSGVYQAAADAGKLAIGVDSNQNYLHPGTMLTSMVKRVDLAVYDTFAEARADTWQAGVRTLGLAQGGVDWAYDEYNESLITADMKAKVEQAKADIIAGKIAVHDYMSDNSCTY